MIPLIVSILLACWIIWVGIRNEEAIAILFLAFPIVLLVAAWAGAYDSPTLTLEGVKPIEIVQLKTHDNQSMKGGGSFLGWHITSESKPQYVIMRKHKGVLMIRRFLDQTTTYIVETDSYPRVEYPSFDETYSKWWNAPWLWNNTRKVYKADGAIIFVPVGTVITKYEQL